MVVNPEMRRVIEDYGNLAGKPNDLLFPVLDSTMTPLDMYVRYVRTKSFIKFVDENMKQIAWNKLEIDKYCCQTCIFHHSEKVRL